MLAKQLTFVPALRRCSRCGVEKPVTEFHRRGDGYQWWCKPCRKTYDAQYHAATKAIRVQQKNERKIRLTEWMRELKNVPCADCGGRFHPAAMQFDHLPGTQKVGSIADLIRVGLERQARAEVLKCEVVCANCHAIRTFRRWEEARAKKKAGISEGAGIYLIAA